MCHFTRSWHLTQPYSTSLVQLCGWPSLDYVPPQTDSSCLIPTVFLQLFPSASHVLGSLWALPAQGHSPVTAKLNAHCFGSCLQALQSLGLLSFGKLEEDT